MTTQRFTHNTKGLLSSELGLQLAGPRQAFFRPFIEGQDIRLGMGYSTMSGAIRTLAVSDTSPPAADPRRGGKLTLDIRFAESREEVLDSLDISAAMSFSGITGGVNIAAHVANERKYNSYSSFLIVNASFKYDPIGFANRTLDQYGKQLLVAHHNSDFYQKYGNCFVDTLSYGGELISILEISWFSKSEKDEFDAQAKGQTAGLQGSASVKSAYQSLTSGKNIKFHVECAGVKTRYPSLDVEALIDYAVAFGALVQSDGVPALLGFTINDYAVCDNIPAGSVTLDTSPAEDLLIKLAQLKSQIETTQANVVAISSAPYLFDPTPAKSTIDSWSATLNGLLGQIDSVAKRLIDDPFSLPAVPAIQQQADALRNAVPTTFRLRTKPLYCHYSPVGYNHITNDSSTPPAGWVRDPLPARNFWIMEQDAASSPPNSDVLALYGHNPVNILSTHPWPGLAVAEVLGRAFTSPVAGTMPVTMFTRPGDYLFSLESSIPGLMGHGGQFYAFPKPP